MRWERGWRLKSRLKGLAPLRHKTHPLGRSRSARSLRDAAPPRGLETHDPTVHGAGLRSGESAQADFVAGGPSGAVFTARAIPRCNAPNP